MDRAARAINAEARFDDDRSEIPLSA